MSVFPTESNISMVGVGLLGRTTSGAGKSSRLSAVSVRSFCSVYSTSEVDTLLAGKANSSHTHAQSDVTGLVSALAAKADLVGGLVPSSQLPSYVDDVIEGANLAAFPGTGETGKIYVALDTGRTYRWSGSAYVELTDATAVWGSISGTLSNQTDLSAALTARALTTTTISAGTGLSGGGDLSANRSLSVVYGTTAGTSCQGNDSRLSDARTPTAHNQAWSTITGTPTTLSGYGITDAQPLDSDLTAIAALTTTTYGRSLLTGADAAETRTTLGLGTLATQSGTFSGTSSGTNTGDQTITLTGDVTGSGTGSFATTIANSAVTNAMLAGSIAISKLAITGTPDGTKFLRDDGTWAAASGGSGITSLGGQTGSTQTFQTATTGTDFSISSTGDVHTFAIPDASASARGLVTTGAQTFVGQKTFAQGTLTSSAPLTLTQTWNSSGTAFNGLLVNCTNTASLGPSFGTIGSTVADFQVGGSSVFRVRRDGAILGGSGTFPPVMIASTPRGNSGWNFGIAQNTETRVSIASDGVSVYSSGVFGWTGNSNDSGAALDLALYRDAANTLALRNSTNAQTFNIANTYTSSTSFEYGRFQWASNEFRIGTAVGSAGGTVRSMVFGSWNSAGTWAPAMTIGSNRTVTFNQDGSVSNAAWTAGVWTLNAAGSNKGLYTAVAGASGGKIIFYDSTGVLYGTGSGQNTYMQYDGWSGHSFAITATGGSAPIPFRFTDAAYTALTASTEMTSVNFNLAQTKTFAAGALTTQRAFRIQAPTYAFASASTITTASTLAISGAPTAGTNATITNAYALNVESGTSNFQRIYITDGSSFIETANWAGGSMIFTFAGSRNTAIGGSGIRMALGYPITFCSDTGLNNPDVYLYRDAAGTVAQRNSTNAQTFRVYNTYTSATNAEWYQQSWASNELRLGTAVGSAGGTGRSLVLGSWNSAGTWTAALTISAASSTVTCSGNITLATQITFNSDSAFRRTSAGIIEVNNGTSGTLRDLCLRNFAVNSATFSSGGGVGIVYIANATTVPTTDPTGGGILYVEGGALKYRGSSGTVTTLANA